MAERNEISIHEVRIYKALTSADAWLTNHEISQRISGVAPRTVRAHTLKLVRLGLLEQAEVFPAHKYRISPMAAKRNKGYSQRIEAALAVFGDEA